MPAVRDTRIGMFFDWDSWEHWRAGQKPRSPRRNIWVISWHLSPFGTPVAAGWIGWPGWPEWKFAQRAPEHVAFRKHADGGMLQAAEHPGYDEHERAA